LNSKSSLRIFNFIQSYLVKVIITKYYRFFEENNNPVLTLPDGTHSVMVVLSKIICFGEILPCEKNKPDQPSCISREVGLLTRGAKEGQYRIQITYCYSYEYRLLGNNEFMIRLVKS